MTGKEIKKLRLRMQLSQKDFAQQLGVERSFVSKLETEKRLPSKELIQRMKQRYHCAGGFLPMEAKIDFLRVRFKIDSPEDVIEAILRMDAAQFFYKDYGLNHYTETYQFSEIFVFHNPTQIDMGVMIELRGQGCREYERILEEQHATWTDFFWRLYEPDLFGDDVEIDTKITRIDLALDELVADDDSNYSLYELKDKYEKGLVDTTFQNFDYRGGYLSKTDTQIDKGLSLYFGSRKSPLYFNFYQKDYELAKKEMISVEMARQKYGIKNRYEVRLANEKAYLFVDYLLSTGETVEWVVRELIDTAIKVYDTDEQGKRIGYSEHWRNVMDSMQELRLTMKGEKPNYDKALRWLSHYLAPTLKKIWLIDQAMGTNELMERIQQAELKDKDEETITTITRTIKQLLLKETPIEVREMPTASEQEIEQLLADYLFN